MRTQEGERAREPMAAAVGTRRRPLVVCYGNALRGDDGLGERVADEIERDPRFRGIVVVRSQQLTPELAVEIAESSRVVLVDADIDGARPGHVRVTEVRAGTAPVGASHDVSPATLLALASSLFGREPRMHVVSVTIARFDVGAPLSRPVAGSVPVVLDALARLVQEVPDA